VKREGIPRITNLVLSLHALLIALAVLLLYLLVVLNSLHEFGLDQRRLRYGHHEHVLPQERRQLQETDLLFTNLAIPTATSLSFQRLDSFFEIITEIASILNQIIQLCSITLRFNIVHVVQRPQVRFANPGNIVIELLYTILNG
jgi:hypothetical protein